MKKIFIAMLILSCIICAGCFQANFDLTITEEGAVYRTWRIMGTAPFSQQIANLKAKNEKLFPNIQVKNLVEGDMLGYEFKLAYPDIESFAQSASEFYGATDGKNKGISRRAGWFFDEYEFDFYSAYPPANIPLGATMNQAMFSEVIYDSVINLPYPAEATNADEVSDGGKLLKWNLVPLVIHGGERSMQVRFKIWHREHAALTAAAELFLLTATIFFLIKARSEELEKAAADLRFKRNVFALLFLAVILISAYMLATPVVFTDADIISATIP